MSNSNNKNQAMNPDAGEDVTKDATKVGLGTVIIHTVTAGKVFELSSATIGGYLDSNTVVALLVRNVADEEQYRISILGITGCSQESYIFPTPISIPAGWDVCLYQQAGTNSFAFIHGKEKVA